MFNVLFNLKMRLLADFFSERRKYHLSGAHVSLMPLLEDDPKPPHNASTCVSAAQDLCSCQKQAAVVDWRRPNGICVGS